MSGPDFRSADVDRGGRGSCRLRYGQGLVVVVVVDGRWTLLLDQILIRIILLKY